MNVSTLGSFIPIIAISGGVALYQLCLKRIPASEFPFQLLTIVYTVSAVLTLILSNIFPSKYDSLQLVKSGGLNLLLLSAAPVIIEVGYLLAFKYGWGLALLNGSVSALCFFIALAVGFLLFREQVSGPQWLAVACFAAGFYFSTK